MAAANPPHGSSASSHGRGIVPWAPASDSSSFPSSPSSSTRAAGSLPASLAATRRSAAARARPATDSANRTSPAPTSVRRACVTARATESGDLPRGGPIDSRTRSIISAASVGTPIHRSKPAIVNPAPATSPGASSPSALIHVAIRSRHAPHSSRGTSPQQTALTSDLAPGRDRHAITPRLPNTSATEFTSRPAAACHRPARSARLVSARSALEPDPAATSRK